MDIFNLQDKVAVITGGGSGIGKAIAKKFGEQGAAVCIIDLDQATASRTAEEIVSAGGRAAPYPCNVGEQAQVTGAVDHIFRENGRVDILVNSAGISHVGTLETTTESDLDRIYTVNIKGVYNCMFAVIGKMVQQGGGVILNLASIASSIGLPDRFAYSMSKGAVLTMTLSVAKDYIGKNIRCNCISPARVHTPFVDGFLAKNYPGREKEMFDKLSKTQPIGRMAKPEEIAALALYLCSDEAGFITGCDYPIDGGFIRLNN